MDVRESAVRHAFAEQARSCERLGSPFMTLLLRIIGRGLDHSTPGVLTYVWADQAERLARTAAALDLAAADPPTID